ncbi:DNA excision repair protein ERCC6 [Carpediemonas membranifera]|uniref:DNA excision repair protein ERCC6 n=1 Tax=Carpediemonas membranifera TaxID=201153 RepID=A0A8J6AXT5_9EUKA|nr:DNA excision repair protein ERCC6 [Carpediemonas membranifera]|eukprot:KAG9395120.1 DNA excision repair protein ERCC6 [Carpediemonas membranifera]
MSARRWMSNRGNTDANTLRGFTVSTVNVDDYESMVATSLDANSEKQYLDVVEVSRTRIRQLLKEIGRVGISDTDRRAKTLEIKSLERKIDRTLKARAARRKLKQRGLDTHLFHDTRDPLDGLDLNRLFPAARAVNAAAFHPPTDDEIAAAFEDAAGDVPRSQDPAEDEEGVETLGARFTGVRFDPALPPESIADGLMAPYPWHALLPYQQQGVQWLASLYARGVGGILGDAMGLGKTVQVAVFLAALHISGQLGPTLVVCPLSVLGTWVRSLRTWWAPLRVSVLHRSAGMAAEETLEAFSDQHVLVTTYDGMKQHHGALRAVSWAYMVLDEGHVIRNPDALVTRVAKSFNVHRRLVMTGTPIQNGLDELWSLIDFVYPGRLGTLPVFRGEFQVPIRAGTFASATAVQIECARACSVALQSLVRPLLLRRTKAIVKSELPVKSEKLMFLKLSPLQESLYRTFLGTEPILALKAGRPSGTHLYAAVNVLRQICRHPDTLSDEVAARLGYHIGADRGFGDIQKSTKVQALFALMGKWRQRGDRVLVFMQSVTMLDIVEQALVQHEYSYRRIDGSTPVNKRNEYIDEFNAQPPGAQDIFAFILTTRSCGVGVNLLGANKVVILSPDWNPQVDEQARDRCWRLGQSRQVTVIRFVCRGTIEHRIIEKQSFKKVIAERVLARPDATSTIETSSVKQLLTLDIDSVTVAEAAKSSLGGRTKAIKRRAGPDEDDFLGLEGMGRADKTQPLSTFSVEIARDAVQTLSASVADAQSQAGSSAAILQAFGAPQTDDGAVTIEVTGSLVSEAAMDAIDAYLLRETQQRGGATRDAVIDAMSIPRTPPELGRLDELLAMFGFYDEEQELWVHSG